MLKCDYNILEYIGRYIPFWNLTLRDLSLSVASYNERSLEHEGRYIPFWALTLKDMSLIIASYDERSLEHDPSVYYDNQRKKLISSLLKKEFPINIEIVTENLT